MPTITTSSARQRNPLLDLWRGIALVDMAWVHLASYPIGMPDVAAAWIGEHVRFAAGCFVLLSGITVCTVFGPALTAGGDRAREATMRLFRRALLLLAIDRLTGVAFAVIEAVALDRPPSGPALADSVLALATFGAAGATGGLLLLYALLLVATPLLERLRLRIGAPVVLLVSLGVFALAQTVGATAHWPPWTFPVAHWQALFVIGYLVAPLLQDCRPRFPAMKWNVLATVVVVAVFTMRSGPALGLFPSTADGLVFRKVPLNPAELVWYVAATAFVLSWSGWLHERSALVRRSTRWLIRLGQWSLLAYVAHLLLELPLIAFVTRVDPSPMLRATMLPLMALALSIVAILAERLEERNASSAWRTSPFGTFRRLLPAAGTAGTGVAVASLLCVAVLRSVAPSTDFALPDVTLEPPLELVEEITFFAVDGESSEEYQLGETPEHPFEEGLELLNMLDDADLISIAP